MTTLDTMRESLTDDLRELNDDDDDDSVEIRRNRQDVPKGTVGLCRHALVPSCSHRRGSEDGHKTSIRTLFLPSDSL